jgi:uncharacterized low-complexity protein
MTRSRGWFVTALVAAMLAIGAVPSYAQNCSFDSDCKGNGKCSSGKCGACGFDSDCNVGKCSNGKCGACGFDSDCKGGKCSGGRCSNSKQ